MKSRFSHYLLLIITIFGMILPAGSAWAVVDLLYFMATPGSTTILLTWETATEFDNIGFYVLRGENAAGPFEPISPRILSLGDPLMGQLYSYEDVTVSIGVQYYYVLEILNADSTSDFTVPIAAIIPAPTATPTITPTRTQTPIVSITPTPTFTPTSLVVAAQTATSALPTNTSTPTQTPTATTTRTATTTLGPISTAGVSFPALTPSPSITLMAGETDESSPEVAEAGDAVSGVSGTRVLSIVVLVIILWIGLAVFLFLVVRHFSRNEQQNP